MRQVVLAFVLLAVVCGTWLWLRSDGADALHAPRPANGRADATAASAKEAVTAPVAESTAVRAEAPVATPDAAPFPADAQWLDVRIVDAATKQPVAGADVRWLDAAAYGKLQATPQRDRAPFVGNDHRTALHFGRQTLSDHRGVARVTTGPDGVSVFASEGSRYGMTHCADKVPPEGHVLELRQDVTLRVQVLDAHGEPAVGASVRVRFGAAGKPDENRGWIQPALARSPDGIAEFQHVQDWLRGGGPGPDASWQWRVALHLPGLDDAGVPFDRNAVPAEPIVLRLPPLGVVAARLLHEGRPWGPDAAFRAWAPPDDDYQKHNQAQREFPDNDGWARLRVPLRASLTVSCEAGNLSLKRSIEGPIAERQEVRVEFRTDAGICLVGRVLGADGHPLAGGTVLCNYDLANGAAGFNCPVSTDASGRFVWLLTAAPEKPTRLKSIVWVHTPGDGAVQRATTVGPRELVAGINDLGDTRLQTQPLVVSGRLQWDPPDDKSQTWVEVERLLPARNGEGAERWDRVAELAAEQRPDGTFAMRGELEQGRYRLRVGDANNLPVEPVEFRLGQQDVVIAVAAGSPLFASILLPAGLVRHHVRGVLRPSGTIPTEAKLTVDGLPERYLADTWQKGEAPNPMSWRALPSGTYALEVRANGQRGPLAVIADVVVPAPPGGDPRLVDIDLRDKVRAITVRSTTPAPAERGRDGIYAFVEPREGADEWEGATADGDLVMPAPPRGFELVVASPGCRPARVTVGATQAAVDVALEPWSPVAITFQDLPVLPAGVKVWCQLRDVRGASNARYRCGGESGRLDSLLRAAPGSAVVANGTATLAIGDGTYRVSAWVKGANDRRSSLRTLTPPEVVGGPGVAALTIRVMPDEVRAALEELQKPAAGK